MVFSDKCPSCRQTTCAGDLLPSRKTEEIQEHWQKLRSLLAFPAPRTDTSTTTTPCQHCNIPVESQQLDAHANICPVLLSFREETNPSAPITAKKPISRYFLPYYRSFSDRKLRTLMKDKKLIATGPRDELIKRHREFILQCTVQQDRTPDRVDETLAAERANQLVPKGGILESIPFLMEEDPEPEIDMEPSPNPKANLLDHFGKRKKKPAAKTPTTRRRASSIVETEEMVPDQALFSQLIADVRNRQKKPQATPSSLVHVHSSPSKETEDSAGRRFILLSDSSLLLLF